LVNSGGSARSEVEIAVLDWSEVKTAQLDRSKVETLQGHGRVLHRLPDLRKNRTPASAGALDQPQSTVEVRARRDRGETGGKLRRGRW
jgi:hypothetical protein